MNRYLIALANLEGPRMTQNWEWVAPHLSRRIPRISEQRARDLVARNGGQAKRMREAR